MQRTLPLLNLLVTLVLLVGLARVGAQSPNPTAPSATIGSAFTYQGELRNASGPVNGHCDLEFSLWDAVEGGTRLGSSPLRQNAVAVTQGRFAVQLDFGASPFGGQARYLQIAVACPAGSDTLTPLTPRQALSAVPYALHAQQASSAQTASSVPWSGISVVPAGFADGVDNDTTYRAGSGLVLSSGSTFSVDTSAIQTRVSGSCAPGSMVSAINADGTVSCASSAQSANTVSWSGISGVPAGLNDGDDNTTYLAGPGLTLTDDAFSIDPSTVQARLTGSCAPGSMISEIAEDGAVSCASSVSSAGSAPWSGITGRPSGLDDGDNDTLADLSCSTEQLARWNGSQWVCSAEVTVPTAYLERLLMSTKIAFMSGRDSNAEIYVMHADGSNPTNLTNNGALDHLPTWSPDGSKIAFNSDRDSNYEIYVMHADGSNQTRLTNNGVYDEAPTWSPDGTKIAFVSNRDGNSEIYVMNADGSNQTRLTTSADNYSPAWSPDGTKIAFGSNRDGNDEIYVMDADGSNQTRLTTSPATHPAFDAWPAWSPDSSKIAFASTRDGNYEIYVMHADGSNQMRLTTNGTGTHDMDPAWSPDGSKIAFVSDRDGNSEIYVMNADGSNQTRLTTNAVTDDRPAW